MEDGSDSEPTGYSPDNGSDREPTGYENTPTGATDQFIDKILKSTAYRSFSAVGSLMFTYLTVATLAHGEIGAGLAAGAMTAATAYNVLRK